MSKIKELLPDSEIIIDDIPLDEQKIIDAMKFMETCEYACRNFTDDDLLDEILRRRQEKQGKPF